METIFQNLSAAPVSTEELEEALKAWNQSSLSIKSKKEHPMFIFKLDTINYIYILLKF